MRMPPNWDGMRIRVRTHASTTHVQLTPELVAPEAPSSPFPNLKTARQGAIGQLGFVAASPKGDAIKSLAQKGEFESQGSKQLPKP
jgi:hypothetical protein